MMTFLLIYTHIAALVLGTVVVDWWATRKDFWVDVCSLAFIVVLWPVSVPLMIKAARS